MVTKLNYSSKIIGQLSSLRQTELVLSSTSVHSCLILKTAVKGKTLLWQAVGAHSGKKASETSEHGCQGWLAASCEPGAPADRLLWVTEVSPPDIRHRKKVFPGSKRDQAGFATPWTHLGDSHKWQHTTPPAKAEWAELLRSPLLISTWFLWNYVISTSSGFEVPSPSSSSPCLKIRIICILRRSDISECKRLVVILGMLAMRLKSEPWNSGQHWILSKASAPPEVRSSHFSESAGSLFWERLLLQYYKIGTHKITKATCHFWKLAVRTLRWNQEPLSCLH